jgi:hypothetical protein
MNINKSFKSNYLKASDLEEEGAVVTITGLRVEEVGKDKEQKPVVYFEEFEQGMVLNKTNAGTISQILGSNETDDWAGKRIAIFPTTVDFGGQAVEAIRVKARAPKATATTAVPAGAVTVGAGAGKPQFGRPAPRPIEPTEEDDVIF